MYISSDDTECSVCSLRSDTVRYALDILSILTVVPKTQILLCESIAVLDDGGATVSTVGKMKCSYADKFLQSHSACVYIW